jgi:hypothetical protein
MKDAWRCYYLKEIKKIKESYVCFCVLKTSREVILLHERCLEMLLFERNKKIKKYYICFCVLKTSRDYYYFLFQINFLVFLNHFDVSMLKIILKKIKNIILIHF